MLSLQHLAGLRVLIDQVEDLLTEASASTRVVTVTDELLASLDADAEALPITFAAVRRLNAEEPYRLKLSFVRVRLQRTRDRLASGTPHEPGRDYRHLDELLADLTLIRDSMLANGDRLSADGAILRLIRTTRAIGLGLATLDVREHSERHHAALARPRRPRRRAGPALRRPRPRGPHGLPLPRDGQPSPAGRCRPRRPGRRGHRGPRRLRRHPGGPGHLRPRRRGDLHRLDDPRRRRPLRRRGPRPRGRTRRPRRSRRPGRGEDRVRPAVRDRRRARGGRSAARGPAERPVLPPGRGGARRRAGDHARLLRLVQGRGHRRVPVADPPGPARAARRRPRARCRPAAVPRPRRFGGPGWRSDRRGDPVAARRQPRRPDQDHRAGRGAVRQVHAAQARPAQPRERAGRRRRGVDPAPDAAARARGPLGLGRGDGRRRRGRTDRIPGARPRPGPGAVLRRRDPRRRAGQAQHRLPTGEASRRRRRPRRPARHPVGLRLDRSRGSSCPAGTASAAVWPPPARTGGARPWPRCTGPGRSSGRSCPTSR